MERIRENLEVMIRGGRWDELSRTIAQTPASVRWLLSLTYSEDSELRGGACRGLGIAAGYHRKQVSDVVRRLVWAMNDESGTFAVNAPEVMLALSEYAPEILLPVVPDLARLSGDEALHGRLAATLERITRRFPGEVGQRMGKSLMELRRHGTDRGQ